MTYGERLARAMSRAGIDQPALATRVRDLRKEEGLDANISQQTVSKALRAKRSAYTSWFARALQVNFDWLENEIGDMVVKARQANSDWPFPLLSQQRYAQLRPEDKVRIQTLVIAMVDAFEEAETGTGPPQKKLTRKRR